MSSLKFILKDRGIEYLFLVVWLIFGLVYCVYAIDKISCGIYEASMIRTLIKSTPALLIGVFICPRWGVEFIKVLIDLKKQELITDIFYVSPKNYWKCEYPFLGAFQELRCKKKVSDPKGINVWWYKSKLDYPSFISNEKYKVTYYKYSKCINEIERITFDNKQRVRKKKEKNVCKINKNIDYYDIYFHNNVDGFIIWLFVIVFSPILYFVLNTTLDKSNNSFVYFSFLCNFIVTSLLIAALCITVKHILSYWSRKKERIVHGEFIVTGIPFEKVFVFKGKAPTYIVPFKNKDNKDNKQVKMFIFSKDVLGFGDFSERSGYLGYGNFIGTKYEIEYYKVSHVIKSIKLISEIPKESCDENVNRWFSD